ncbi:hypothetical protein K2173_022059 [Erythroxylum novogranatense]|uniref:Uncharacterized protein n=1 Tax=Erythroxylum novogranatense TaxID=1862640 RepID=A0AAV8T2N8_9ROSI|nr:hypothetical protein K2173_022059 [Erythroxylum novogranatense]
MVGYFLGKRLAFLHIQNWAQTVENGHSLGPKVDRNELSVNIGPSIKVEVIPKDVGQDIEAKVTPEDIETEMIRKDIFGLPVSELVMNTPLQEDKVGREGSPRGWKMIFIT